ncbi:hypothetical protein [Rhodococcus sp. NPDC004095]
MKRLSRCAFGLLLALPLAAGCGENSATDVVSDALPNSIGGSECADANLAQNLTPDEFARENTSLQYAIQGPDSFGPDQGGPAKSTRAEVEAVQLAMYGELVAATPAGQQAKFADVACAEVRDFYGKPMDHLTAALEYGYGECKGALLTQGELANPQHEPLPPVTDSLESIISSAELVRLSGAMDEVVESGLGKAQAAAFEYLCPQVEPLAAKPGSNWDVREYCDATVDGSGGNQGLVLVAFGDVKCEDAVAVIEDAFGQLERNVPGGITVKNNGQVQYICGGPIPTSPPVESPWDYKCESPMGDTVIIWNNTEA